MRDADLPGQLRIQRLQRAALRDHDETNFDVRETIDDCAEALVEVLEEWLGVGGQPPRPRKRRHKAHLKRALQPAAPAGCGAALPKPAMSGP
ncbi:hypothetical protein ACNQVK_03245 [Mycobacterium sp. 134]|uniref:hypothetical protein n=1 Tax=Mycobacterium sp. 134 TaxID=3400425 RepID=UPI003AB0AFD9